jgi:hypothetical protein
MNRVWVPYPYLCIIDGHKKFKPTYPSKPAFPGIDELSIPAPPVVSMFVYNRKTDKSMNIRNTNKGGNTKCH